MSRHREARNESALSRKLSALNQARELGEGRLDPAVLDQSYTLLERAATRRSLSADHTVVGFFGATGSGKSSLFNAVVGANVADVAVRRPTTSEPLAMVWTPEGSEPLLDWLDVAVRKAGHAVKHLASPGDGDGLILLDLPDLDSIQRSNREIVERLSGQVDVLVWVLDPQKYADAAIHDDFIEPLSAHGSVTLVVLNQIDKLAPYEVDPVKASLRSILAADGLAGTEVLGVSAMTGAGVEELRKSIAQVVKAKRAQSARLSADVELAAQAMASSSGEGHVAGIHQEDRKELLAGLSKVGNVDSVVDAVRASYRLEATRQTGWPVTRWISRFRKDPLRRLGLRNESAPELRRTSMPVGGVAQSATMETSVRKFADQVSSGASEPWRDSIRLAARSRREELAGALDQAVANTDLKANSKAWWWPIFSVVQWLALAAAVGGLLWLGVLAALGYFQLPVPETPKVEGWPVPTLLVLTGVVLGIFVAVTSKILAAVGAGGRATSARRRLRESVSQVAEDYVIAPTEAEIARYQEFSEALKAALKG